MKMFKGEFGVNQNVVQDYYRSAFTKVKGNNDPIFLWMRLGVSVSVTPEEFEELKKDGEASKEALLKLLKSGKCEVDGDTYFPVDGNEDYLNEDLNFDLPTLSFKIDNKSKEQVKTVEKPALDDQISAAVQKGSDKEKPLVDERDIEQGL